MISGPYYINLDHRTDRRQQVEAEFKRLGIDSAIRFPAIYHTDGLTGCQISHIMAIDDDPLKVDATWICEDDIQILVDRVTLDLHIKEFMESDADILCLGGASRRHEDYSTNLLRSFDLQTTSSYIVKNKFKDALLILWNTTLNCRLYKTENPYKDYFNLLNVNKGDPLALDMSWKILQQSHIFVIPKTKCIVQRASYSDIEKQFVNYGT